MSQQSPESSIDNTNIQSVGTIDAGDCSQANNIQSISPTRKNPKRFCCKSSNAVENVKASGSESEIKVKRRRNGSRIAQRRINRRSHLNEQITLLKSIIPSAFMTEHGMEYMGLIPKQIHAQTDKNKPKQIFRPGIIYSSIRYIEHLKHRIEQLENGKDINKKNISSFVNNNNNNNCNWVCVLLYNFFVLQSGKRM